ncbi:hypothetical protein EW145_g8133 [Phellinidium pouzarii]|uniref:Uncharacterized protein n=1 Tax=Phellinidium pouzarii TaxID=167371 RepID=A0A4S4K983_9AGAM|nr:hypothetical protein EW145_g8133 [Phellinidium pouzarii]
MLLADVAPDAASVDAVVGAFFAVKAFRLARRVLLDLWPMVAPFPEELRDASLLVLTTRLRETRREIGQEGQVAAKTTVEQQQQHRTKRIIWLWKAEASGKQIWSSSYRFRLKAIIRSSRSRGKNNLTVPHQMHSTAVS